MNSSLRFSIYSPSNLNLKILTCAHFAPSRRINVSGRFLFVEGDFNLVPVKQQFLIASHRNTSLFAYTRGNIFKIAFHRDFLSLINSAGRRVFKLIPSREETIDSFSRRLLFDVIYDRQRNSKDHHRIFPTVNDNLH